MMDENKKMDHWVSGILYLIFAVVIILAVNNKVDLHVDEVYSYGLANSVNEGICMEVESGHTYYPSPEPWLNYMTVNSDYRFNYSNVWLNQSKDVHPPLYYVLLHTICSLFPEIYSIWFAAVINIVFAVLTLFVVRKLVMLLVNDLHIKELITVAFIASAGIISETTFMRMYIVAMFWVTLLCFLFAKQIGNENNWRLFYVTISAVTAAGALTHYYVIVFAVLISIFFGCYLLIGKRWKRCVCFCISQGVAAMVSIAVFPAMLKHMFVGDRGVEAVKNLTSESVAEMLARFRIFYDMLDIQLFGGLLLYFVVIAVLLFITCVKGNIIKEVCRKYRVSITRYLCIIIPSVLYFGIISKSAGYMSDRYMAPIYAVLFTIGLCSIWMLIKYVWHEGVCGRCIYIFIIAAMTVNGWKNVNWTYLFQDAEAILDASVAYTGVDCVYVYKKPWETHPAYNEVRNYNSVTFYKENELDMLAESDLSSRYELIVMVTNDDESTLKRILELCPELKHYYKIGGYAYTTTYFFSTVDQMSADGGVGIHESAP